MPKTSESPLYLYWDKALLLILAAAAVYIVLTQVVSSPIRSNKASGREKLGPREIVTQVSVKTEALARKLQSPIGEPIKQPQTVEKVAGYLEGTGNQLRYIPLTPQLPGEDVQPKTATPAVLPPGNIRARGSIGIMASAQTSRTTSTTTRYSKEMYWVTIAADFPFRKQYLAFAGRDPRVDKRSRLDARDHRFIFARLELERQQLQPDGSSWSDSQSVDPYQTYNRTVPKIVQGLSKLYSLPLGFEEEDLKNRDALRTWLSQSGFQEFIVRPEFLPLDGFEQWDWPQEPPKKSDEQAGDWQLAGAIPSDTAPNYVRVSRSTASGLRNLPNSDVSYDLGAFGRAPSRQPLMPIRATKASRASSNRIALPQNYRLEDAPDSVPIWAHDSSVEPGVTYRYRLRVAMFNPLCGSEQAQRSVRRPGWLNGQWSAWSEPVKTLQDRYFFFSGISTPTASKPSRARVSVYAWKSGYWFSKLFSVDPGQAIGSVKEVPDPAVALPNPNARLGEGSVGIRTGTQPLAPSAPARTKVDFTTGWTAVELNLDVKVKRPIADKPGELQTVTAHELVVKNTKTSQTDKRYIDVDKNDPQKRALYEIIKRQKAALRPQANPGPRPRPSRRDARPKRGRGGVPPGRRGGPMLWE